MKKKDFVFLVSNHHSGMWFVSNILEFKLQYDLRGCRDMIENDIDPSAIESGHVFNGHLTAFERQGSGIIDFRKIKETYDCFNKNSRCLALIPLRDPLAALVSAGRRGQGNRQSGLIISEYVSIAKDFHALNPLYFPVDLSLSLPEEERYAKHLALLVELEKRIGMDLGGSFKEDLARNWNPVNVTTDYCINEYGNQKLELKDAYENGDIDYIKKEMPKEWEYLIEMREILQPFFEKQGYENLLWYGKKKDNIKNIPNVKAECNFTSTVLSKLYPKSVLSVDSYPHFTHRMAAQYDVTSVHMRREARIPKPGYKQAIIGDAKRLNLFEDDSFDAVVSLGSLEYIGLGRYGGQVDYDTPEKAFHEMRRALKPGGHLIFTLPVTMSGINVLRVQPVVVPIDRRIYSMEEIEEQHCKGMVPIKEKYFSLKTNDFCTKEDVTDNWKPEVVEFIYMGCWMK